MVLFHSIKFIPVYSARFRHRIHYTRLSKPTSLSEIYEFIFSNLLRNSFQNLFFTQKKNYDGIKDV